MCLMWCIWYERNARHFEYVETSVMELQKTVVNMLHIWISGQHSLFGSNFADFLTLCSSFSSS
jgi:hypothetical protein